MCILHAVFAASCWSFALCCYLSMGSSHLSQSYFVEVIAVVSMLFMEWQNSTLFLRYYQFNFWGLDFYIVNIGVVFSDFFTIFAYKILNIDVESTKFVTKMQTMARITK